MVDTGRQVPSPSASAWLIDLSHVDGPQFVVFRLSEIEARQAVVGHVVENGAIANTIAAERLVAAAPASQVGVVW
jgi:hypothetical protein